MSKRLIQDLHAGISRRDWWGTETPANRLRDEVEQTVAILAGTNVGSLPNDYPLSRLASDALAAKDAEIEQLKGLNSDAHAIVARIWEIFGTPSYEELAGRTIYDLVQQQHDALEPFAKVADRDIGEDETDDDLFRPMMQHNRAPRLTVGDLRAARAALAGGSDA